MDTNTRKKSERLHLHLEITQHIFANSPAMLAFCLTSIGLIKIYSQLQRSTTLTDDSLLIAIAAFFLSTGASYLALRSRMGRFKVVMAQVADICFLTGLLVTSIVAAVIVRSLAG